MISGRHTIRIGVGELHPAQELRGLWVSGDHHGFSRFTDTQSLLALEEGDPGGLLDPAMTARAMAAEDRPDIAVEIDRGAGGSGDREG
jgi:hypothetical protein